MSRKASTTSETVIKGEVRRRDNYRCAECGMTEEQHVAKYGRTLDVHRLAPGSIYTLEGCITLCRPCHRLKPRRTKNQPDLANPDPGVEFVAPAAWLATLDKAARALGMGRSAYIRMAVNRQMSSDRRDA